jgi:hypothetical protein
MRSFTIQQRCSPRSDSEPPKTELEFRNPFGHTTRGRGCSCYTASASERRANRRPQRESTVFFVHPFSLIREQRLPHSTRPARRIKKTETGKREGNPSRCAARFRRGWGRGQGAGAGAGEAKGRSRGVTWTAGVGREAE